MRTAPAPIRNAAGGFAAIPAQIVKPAQAALPPNPSAADMVAARIAAEVERQKLALISAGRRTVT
jgi:hypothetical protein